MTVQQLHMWYTRRELRELLEVSDRTFTRRVSSGAIVKRKIGDNAFEYRLPEMRREAALPPQAPSPHVADGERREAEVSPPMAQFFARFEEIVRENERGAAESLRQAETIASLQAELRALQADHEALWDVVGELTQEAFELECALDQARVPS